MCKAFFQGVGRKSATRTAIALLGLACLWLAVTASVCLAMPGSGAAEMWPKMDAQAGASGRWTIRYTATEDFDSDGGMVSIEIPAGWSPPQVSDSTLAGYIRVTIGNPDDLDSVTVSGATVGVYLGGRPGRFFNTGEYFELIYGASASLTRIQTLAPDTVEFTVRSDPAGSAPVALVSGSPSVTVIPGSLSSIAVFFGGNEAGSLGFTADDNSNVFSARGLDAYGNLIGGIACAWTLTQSIGTLSGGIDSTTTFDATTVGEGYLVADDGLGHADSTGLITVTHGAYARLDVGEPDSATAGVDFAVSVAALDLDGNRITSGPGNDASLSLSAWLDSLGIAKATGDLSSATLNLTAGQGSTGVTYFVSETIYVRAVDVADATMFDFGPAPTLVKPAPPSILAIEPETLAVKAGSQETFTLTSFDAYGNVSPVQFDQTLYLWKNSYHGEFRAEGGSEEVFQIGLESYSSNVSFDLFGVLESELQVAVMDVDASPPSFPPVVALVIVSHDQADTFLVRGISDPVVAGNPSDVSVEVLDAFGNRVWDYSNSVSFSSSDAGAGTVLPPDYTFAPSDSGRHSFPLAVVLTTAGEQSVAVSDVSNSTVGGRQKDITVLSSDCDSLVLSASESFVPAGSPFDVTVEAIDRFGNRAAGYTGVLAFSSTDSGDSTVLPYYYQFTPGDAGTHEFVDGVRLTQAGTHAVSARDTVQAGIDGEVVGIQVTAGAARSVVLFPPDSFQVNATGTQVMSATVRDAFGNPRQGEQVSIVVRDAADGSLEDDPANPNNTSGGTSIQTGSSDSAGEITVLYRAPATAGLSDTIDAYCTTVPHDSVADVFVTSTPSGATVLKILPVEALADTAGAVFALRVDAIDSFGNLDTSDTSLVRITLSSVTARVSADGGTSWSATNIDSLRLASGSTGGRLVITDTASGSPDVLADDAADLLISGLKDNITFSHALPAGNILVYPGRDTLVADGSSSLNVVAGPVCDAYGNNVGGGVELTVSSLLCEIVAADMDTSTAGTQLVTAQDGKVYFALRSGVFSGTDTVAVTSLSGTARGYSTVALVGPPRFQYVGGSISPTSISAGQSVSFELELENVGGARAYITPLSSLSFSDDNDGTFVAGVSETTVVLPGQRALLLFEPRQVADQLDPGSYSPAVNLTCFDLTGRSFAQVLQAGVNTVHLVAMSVRSVLAPASVLRGESDVEVEVALQNEGSIPLWVTGVGLTFSSPGHTCSLVLPALPDTLQAGETGVFDFLVDVDQSAPLGDCTVDAFANGVSGGISVLDTGADSTAAWTVQSRASVSYVAGSLYAQSVSVGQTRSFSLKILNSGTASVQLDTAGTYVKFGTSPGQYSASLETPTLLAGSAETYLSFGPAQVPFSMPVGKYAVEVGLGGLENGALFADTVFSVPDSVVVNEAGDLIVRAASVAAPNAPFVDTSQVFGVDVEIENVGEETALDVVISLAASGGSATGTPINFGAIDGGARKRLTFPVLAMSSTGIDTFYAKFESAVGAVSGLPLTGGTALDDTAGAVVQLPALLSLSAAITAPAGATDNTLSTTQDFKVTATVQNSGEGNVGTGGTLRADVPSDFALLSPSVQAFVPGSQVEWNLRAPSAAEASATVSISMAGLPLAVNTGAEADTANGSEALDVSVVDRAALSLSAAIVAPEDATDGSVGLQTSFTVEATVSNLGSASTAGTGRVLVSLPAGYSLGDGESAEKDFTVGTPVNWEIVSPAANTPISYMSVVISEAPLDENTSSEALVSLGSREIAVYAESKQMLAEVLSFVEAPPQIAAGEPSVRMLALRVSNPQELGVGSDIGLSALSFYVLGDDNLRLVNPSVAVSAVSVWRYYGAGSIPLGAAGSVATNPVRVEFAPQADTLRPGESDTLLVLIDVAQNLAVGGVALEIEDGSAFEVFELSSGEAIAVVSPDGSGFPQTFSAFSRVFTGVHNFPNPFRAGAELTSISYYLESDSKVTVRIFTLDGRPVYSKTYSTEEPEGRRGLGDIKWDGRNGDGEVVLNGIYICKLEATGIDATFKIAVAK